MKVEAGKPRLWRTSWSRVPRRWFRSCSTSKLCAVMLRLDCCTSRSHHREDALLPLRRTPATMTRWNQQTGKAKKRR